MSVQFKPREAPAGSAFVDTALLILRLVIVTAWTHYQLKTHLVHGWRHVWEKQDWDLVDQMTKLGISTPTVASVLLVLLLFLALLGILLGILTRLNAIVFSLILLVVLFAPLFLSGSLNPQVIVLTIGQCLCFAVAGAGRISLDYLLTSRRANRKARRLEL